jgi:hypothetical protein
MHSVRRGRTTLVAAAVAGMAAVACGGSGYQYVENEDLGVFARLPEDWAVYDTEQLLTEMNTGDDALTDNALERAEASQWFRGFDASDSPSAEGTMALGRSEPRGFVHIRALSREERDLINVSGMRSTVLGIDPLSAGSADAAALGGPSPQDVEVLADEPAEFEGGYHGTHNVFALTQGGDVAIVDQTVLVNAESTQLYVFAVSCNESCYFETNSDEIEAIVESWTIDESSQS